MVSEVISRRKPRAAATLESEALCTCPTEFPDVFPWRVGARCYKLRRMHTTHAHKDVHGHDLRDCIEACSACHDMCQHMIYQHCLQLGGKHVEPEHLKLMADCAQICHTAEDFM